MLLLSNSQKVDLSVQPVDRFGNPAPIDGVPSWSASDQTLVDIVPAANGLLATVVAKGPTGNLQVSVEADADLGGGVTSIVGTLDITIAPSAAVALKITTGTPTEK